MDGLNHRSPKGVEGAQEERILFGKDPSDGENKLELFSALFLFNSKTRKKDCWRSLEKVPRSYFFKLQFSFFPEIWFSPFLQTHSFTNIKLNCFRGYRLSDHNETRIQLKSEYRLDHRRNLQMPYPQLRTMPLFIAYAVCYELSLNLQPVFPHPIFPDLLQIP